MAKCLPYFLVDSSCRFVSISFVGANWDKFCFNLATFWLWLGSGRVKEQFMKAGWCKSNEWIKNEDLYLQIVGIFASKDSTKCGCKIVSVF